jgi:hypothetical protein
MAWKENILNSIKEAFHDKIFSTKDVSTLCKDYSKGSVYRVLHDLVKSGKLERLGKGTYKVKTNRITSKEFSDRLTISDHLTVKLIPGSPMIAKKILEEKGIEFMITGMPVFFNRIHYLPRRLIIPIYVIKGSGENAVFALRESGWKALLEPTFNEINIILETIPDRDIFIIREFSELIGNNNGFANVERALVDLYFETTRSKIPFSEEELARILLDVFREEPISYSRLKEFAYRRGIGSEIKAIIDFLDPHVDGSNVPMHVSESRGQEFLDLLKKLSWR